MALGTFKGGIYPHLNKNITSEKGFSNLSIPHVCYIPLQQHIGNPALPVVKVGDLVKEGQLIGKAHGSISANIHSSIPGKVIEIKDHPSSLPESKNTKCIVIEADGRFSSSGKIREKVSWRNFNKEALLERISEAGIVGMGGQAFPTAVKLSSHWNKRIEHLIINCAESEPYLTADDMLIRTYPAEILEGIGIILKILGFETAYLGIEKNKSKSIQTLKTILEKSALKEKIKLNILKTKYPQGSEKQLIYSIFKKEIPSGRLPADIGIMVLNVGTVFAIQEACVLGKPLFERFVTVSGKIIKKPGNYKIRIGTRISDIIEECGGLKEYPAKIIIGGSMRGTAVRSFDVPVAKGTAGILFLSAKEAKFENYGHCIRCGRCVAVCPMRLLPYEFGKTAIDEHNDAPGHNPFDCISCGSCSFVCPSRIPLTYFIQMQQGKYK